MVHAGDVFLRNILAGTEGDLFWEQSATWEFGPGTRREEVNIFDIDVSQGGAGLPGLQGAQDAVGGGKRGWGVVGKGGPAGGTSGGRFGGRRRGSLAESDSMCR